MFGREVVDHFDGEIEHRAVEVGLHELACALGKRLDPGREVFLKKDLAAQPQARVFGGELLVDGVDDLQIDRGKVLKARTDVVDAVLHHLIAVVAAVDVEGGEILHHLDGRALQKEKGVRSRGTVVGRDAAEKLRPVPLEVEKLFGFRLRRVLFLGRIDLFGVLADGAHRLFNARRKVKALRRKMRERLGKGLVGVVQEELREQARQSGLVLRGNRARGENRHGGARLFFGSGFGVCFSHDETSLES